MKIELEQQLCKRFPLLFRGRHLSLRENLMGFGCENSDGWYNIIYLACLGLEEETKKLYHPLYLKFYRPIALFVHFWNKLVWKLPKFLHKKYEWGYHPGILLLNISTVPMFTQIKEKYGTLRLYMSATTDKMDEYVAIAERASEMTCEICGNHGKVRGTGWLYCACSDHSKPEDLADWERSEGE